MEQEITFELLEDEIPPEGLVGGEDVEGAARSRENAEVAAAEEAEDVEDELVGEDAEGAEAKVPGVGGRIEEEKVAERLDGDGSGGGGGFEIKALLRFVCFSVAVYLLWFEIWGWAFGRRVSG